MSWEVSTETHPVARKDYHCQASDWIDNTLGWGEEDYDEDDRAVIKKALSEGCRIISGTKYLKVSGRYDGEFTTFRAREDLHAICEKYDLYED